MAPSFRLGRLAGIEVGANWSWLIVVALIVWTLAAGVFPDNNPGLSSGAYIAMAAAAAVLFFASLVLHELGHALQARKEGVEIDGITLWAFGGVARFKGMFPAAGAELRIAIAGPVVSLAIGATFLALALVLPLPAAVDGVVHWLGYINLFLLAFNLLPALPLDGGRVLRAALWHFKEDFATATRIASGLGRLFGQFLIAAGLFAVLVGGALGGVWLALIGWFLLVAAEAEAGAARARSALGGLRAADVMVREPVTADPGLTLDRFMDEVFLRHRHVAYPVVEDGTALGLVSFRDVAEVPREDWGRRVVRECMVPLERIIVLRPDRGLADVLGRLAQDGLGRALVCEGGRLEGMLSITDLVRVLEARTVGGGHRRGAGAAADARAPFGAARLRS